MLLLLVYNSAGHAIVFTALRYTVRQEIKALLKQGVPEGELHVLIIPKSVEFDPNSSFQRIHEGEFRYEGKMYDIVRRELRGDTTVYYCVNDVQEEKLFADLDEQIRSALPSSTAAKSTSSIAALKLVIKEAIACTGFRAMPPCRPYLPTRTGLHSFQAISPEIPTPPPRLLFPS